MPNEHFQPALCAIEHRMAIEAKLKDKIEAVFLDSVVRKDAEAILDRYGIESHEQNAFWKKDGYDSLFPG